MVQNLIWIIKVLSTPFQGGSAEVLNGSTPPPKHGPMVYYSIVPHRAIKRGQNGLISNYQLRWFRLPIEERACRKPRLGGGDYSLRTSALSPHSSFAHCALQDESGINP